MNATRLQRIMSLLGLDLASLDEALQGPEDVKAFRDSTILSFTFVYELTWKAMKEALGLVGISARNPRETFQHAYRQEWIGNERFWLDMLEDGDLIVHTYNQDLAKEIYHRIREEYAPEFRKVYAYLQGQLRD
jgi:nucleotidyltransferase substrate binding protein (TIGR01987 family)